MSVLSTGKAPRKVPPAPIRVLMQVLSFFLCVVLFCAVLCAAVLGDLHVLTSSGGIDRLLSGLFSASPAPASPTPPPVSVGGASYAVSRLSSGSSDTASLPDGFPTDIDGLIDYVYDTIREESEEPLSVTKEQIDSFLEKSSVTEFIAEKAESLVEDLLNGTELTDVTTQEILDLVEENRALIQSELGITVTPQMQQELEQAVDKLLLEDDIVGQIRGNLNQSIDDAISGSLDGTSLTVAQLRDALRLLSSEKLLYGICGVCLVLLVLLCLANWYDLPGGLGWVASALLFAGALLSVALYTLMQMPNSPVIPIGADAARVLESLRPVLRLFAPIHYGILLAGVCMLIVSIVWRILRNAVRRRHAC